MKIENKEGLWVSTSFTKKFGNKNIKPAKTVPGFKKLERSMVDKEIQTELSPGESTLEDVAAFLENPPEGTDDGYSNIFYVAGCVVGVDWDRDRREWSVRAWGLDDLYWDAGRRAFGRNLSSESLASEFPQDLDSLTLRITRIEETLKYHNLIYPYGKSL